MEKLKLYTVTKPSSDGTFVAGDIIWLSANGDLNSCKGKGWLSKAEWDSSGTNDFEVEPCKTHYLDVSRWSETVRKVEDISKQNCRWRQTNGKEQIVYGYKSQFR